MSAEQSGLGSFIHNCTFNTKQVIVLQHKYSLNIKQTIIIMDGYGCLELCYTIQTVNLPLKLKIRISGNI